MKQALVNMKAVLEAANSGIDKVVKCTIFVQDITKDFAVINEEYKKGLLIVFFTYALQVLYIL